MLVNCNSCQKKFLVPDSAIVEFGRLLQCGSCGNKWTQYPIKDNLVEKIKKIPLIKIKQTTSVNKIKTLVKKKKREINLYSEEYLKKKHGLTIKDSLGSQDNKKNRRTGFGFYSYIVVISIFTIGFFGVLNLAKDIITASYPVTEFYINYLYEVIGIIRIIIFELIN